jgi:glutamyl-tRNA reductase
MNPGEDQIMRQVRDAVMGARRRGEVDSTLSFALDAALRIARRVRRDVALAPRDTSLFSLVRPDLEELLRHRGGSMRALVVGAGEMARLCATLLKGLPGVELIIVNRTLSRAQALADALGGRAVAWSELASEVDGIDVLVSAIPGSPDVDWSPFVGLGGVSLMVDLGLPSALGGSWAQGLGGRLVDIHALEVLGAQRRHELEGRLSEAERVLRLALDEELGEWAERTLSPSIQRLLALYEAALGDVLPDAQARSLARRLANIPIRGLRALAREHGVEAARTFAFESGLELPHGLQP